MFSNFFWRETRVLQLAGKLQIPRFTRDDKLYLFQPRSTQLLCSALFYRAGRGLGADTADSILDVDWGHYGWIGPPEFLDVLVSRKPGVRLLELVSYQKFGSENGAVFGDQVLVLGNTGDPRGSRGVLVI